LVGDALFGRFRDGAFTKIGPVAQVIDFFFFLRCFGETIVDLI